VRSRQKNPQSRRRHPLNVCNFLKIRADNDDPRRCICGFDDMVGVAGFASESTPRGNISVLSIRIESCYAQSGCNHHCEPCLFHGQSLVPTLTGNRRYRFPSPASACTCGVPSITKARSSTNRRTTTALIAVPAQQSARCQPERISRRFRRRQE